MLKTKLPLFAAIVLTLPSAANATIEIDEATVQELIAHVEALTNRVNELETANRDFHKATTEQFAAVSAENEASQTARDNIGWAEKIKLKGDFRYRVENIDQQGKSERNRQRIRARAAIIAKPTDELELGLGFASGDDDPVSTNQSLGGGGSTKGMNLDLAYFKYTGLANTSIVAGKYINFLVQPGKSSLLWDGDWTPEGFGITWANNGWFVNLLTTWIESDSKKTDTEFSYVLQAGYKNNFDSGAKLTAGVTYIDIGTRGKNSFFGDDDDFFGNSFNPVTNTYLYNYEELELFADLSFKLGGKSASVFLDYVTNQDAGNFDTGYAFGVNIGSAKAAGTWKFGWLYKDIEADAVFGLLTDSDFGGGGTDSKGHVLKGSYAVAKNWNANFTYFINEIDGNLGTEKDYDRLQLDLSFKY